MWPFMLAEVAAPSGVEPFLLGYGVLGLMFLLVLLGWLAPKWIIDQYIKQEEVKDRIIEELSDALHRLADSREVQVTAKSRAPRRAPRPKVDTP